MATQNQTLDRRLELHNLLLTFCPNCYFQPPETVKMKYPCIVYHRDSSNTAYADNLPYRFQFRYTVTAITKDPDDDLARQIAKLSLCRFDRHFTSDNLNHDVFTIYW